MDDLAPIAQSWPVIVLPVLFGLICWLRAEKRSRAYYAPDRAWRRTFVPREGVTSRVFVREPVAFIFGAAAVAAAMLLGVRWVLLEIESPIFVYGAVLCATYLVFVILPLYIGRRGRFRVSEGRNAFDETLLGKFLIKRFREREATQWLQWDDARKAKEKAEYTQRAAELNARQEKCVHEPATEWDDGKRKCTKCGKVLELCHHDWAFVRGYKEENQYQCRHCGMWSY